MSEIQNEYNNLKKTISITLSALSNKAIQFSLMNGINRYFSTSTKHPIGAL